MDEPSLSATEILTHVPHTPEANVVQDAEFVHSRREIPSKLGIDSGAGLDTCRICRSEGSVDEPLFYPCKCSGSIKFVHQECLMEWLSHSHKKHCELCKTPFRFTKLYDANMPNTLPWSVFARRAAVHSALMVMYCCRALLVIGVWFVAMPWLIRWTWRWMFWFADAGWAREDFMRKMRALVREGHNEDAITQARAAIPRLVSFVLRKVKGQTAWQNQASLSSGAASNGTISNIAAALAQLGFDPAFANATAIASGLNTTILRPLSRSWGHNDTSILSSWTYISEMTPYPQLNRVILDICEGQFITCVVISGFILIFLIREWVVQQQPLVNIDNHNHEQRERERQERDRDRRRRQAAVQDSLRLRPTPTADEAVPNGDILLHGPTARAKAAEREEWNKLEGMIDEATQYLREGTKPAHDLFMSRAQDVFRQAKIAEGRNALSPPITLKMRLKLATLSRDERLEWERAIMGELKTDSIQVEESLRLRPTPTRDSSSRALDVQRALDETHFVAVALERSVWPHLKISADTEPASIESDTSAASTESSWQILNSREITPLDETHVSIPPIAFADHDELPITNAGPDAKVNIKRKIQLRASAPLARSDSSARSVDNGLPAKSIAGGAIESEQAEASNAGISEDALQQLHILNTERFESDSLENNPEFEHEEPSTGENRITTVIREEVGFDGLEETGLSEQLEPDPNVEPDEDDGNEDNPEQSLQLQEGEGPPGVLAQITDWFWGDIQPRPHTAELEINPNEEREEEHAADYNGQPRAPPLGREHAAREARVQQRIRPDHDPEVVAAAQEAGLNAEAIEDAEDLEGIFELIGLQGPLIGLFQTSSFCCVLVVATVFSAVGLPYIWGKLVLSFVANPMSFLVKMPLQLASLLADMVIDVVLITAGWFTITGSMALDFLLSALEVWIPTVASYNIPDRLSELGMSTALAAGFKLQDHLFSLGTVNGIGWDSAFLIASAHAHASLKTLQEEVDLLLGYVGAAVTALVDTTSSTSALMFGERLAIAFWRIAEGPNWLMGSLKSFEDQHMQDLQIFLRSAWQGNLTFSPVHTPLDPSLIHWNSNDRALTVSAGYIALAAIAVIYVTLDSPITRSHAGQQTEKMIRDFLRQAGGVLKVIMIISIEMLVFPLYCGMLLDLAFLPLFPEASAATRWAFAVRAPATFGFVHWFVGTCYMFHFALFVGMCRKILRKGVLWFIRDPDDPTFHPVRDVLERNITTQLRKIAFSALVYGALVILCLGGVIWSIGHIFKGIFPIHWISTEPILEFPMDLFLYNMLTPFVIRLFKPSDAVHAIYTWWLQHCARTLRLSHFLFHDRRKEEEGTYIRSSWTSFLLRRKVPLDDTLDCEPFPSAHVEGTEVYFRRDGKYVLTPCNDQYRPPKSGEAFLHVEPGDMYIADKDGKRNENFARIYVPPHFRLRVTLFMVCLWMFSAFTGLCTTLVPLVFGRCVLAAVIPADVHVNDIYAYTVGAYVLGSITFTIVNWRAAAVHVSEKLATIKVKAFASLVADVIAKTLKCIYFYGFLGVVVPLAFALSLQFYLIIPMRTFLASRATPSVSVAQNSSTLFSTFGPTGGNGSFVQFPPEIDTVSKDYLRPLSGHTIHILADYSLGLLYVRILMRGITMNPTSRMVEAFRRITADGLLNPNARLATRFIVIPASTAVALALLAPPAAAKLAFVSAQEIGGRFNLPISVDGVARTALYRYSYPLAAGWVLIVLGSIEMAKITARWRARIRDEVYLVGEKLHNFGEKRPPAGSKTVVRRER